MLDRIATSDLGVETIGRFEDHPLFPEEIQSLGRVVNRRRIEFATGRYCAKKAISWLGVTPSAIVIGDGREPVWPSGIVGSITHCSGYCAAVAAKSSQVLSIGIDAEENLPLPEGVWELIAGNQQQSVLAHHSDTLICWDRLLFCAKEAVYKAWYSITKQWLDFSDCQIVWDPCQMPRSLAGGLICGDFVAQLKRPCRVDRRQIDEFQGRYIASPSHLATLVQVR
jgi:4'-phosphopantetheinyl transferase EntD